MLIDPKQVELGFYENDPHLLKPIITDTIRAQQTLAELVDEMEYRYKILRKAGVRKIEDYKGKMPRIVCVIDEFADLMMISGGSVESLDIRELTAYLKDEFTGRITQKMVKNALKRAIESGAPSAETSIIRIAQKARAVGIHLVLATQRPSADVVTGLIKANIPTKIAFSVTNSINSKIILDETGAEMLTGNGDMLYQDPRANHLERLQGFYV